MKRNLYYVFNGRFPSEKAHALYVAKHTQALCTLGFSVTIVAPRRFGRSEKNYGDFFSMAQDVSVRYLPVLDLSILRVPRSISFWCSSLCFTICVFFFFLWKRESNTPVFTHDGPSTLVLTSFLKKIIYEVHDYPENKKILFGLIARRVFRIVTQNALKKDRLVREFTLAPETIVVEPNGVDFEIFAEDIPQNEARMKLHIPQDVFVVLYTGHLFDWKGAQVLAEAASFLDGSYHVYFVGGSPHDVRAFENVFSNVHNIFVVGYKPYAEIPLWQKAADCLVVPNTAKKDISKFYTAPMKLFEYMASGRIVLASDLPSLRQLADESEVVFTPPDNPKALATAIQQARSMASSYVSMTAAAQKKAGQHRWSARAVRIAQACNLF